MFPALAALIGAVVTAAVYMHLAERLDYSTVQRRQLDVWTSAVAVVCLAAILYGGAGVERRQATGALTEAAGLGQPVQAIPRLRSVSLVRPPSDTVAAGGAELAPEPPPELGLEGGPMPVVDEGAAPGGSRSVPRSDDSHASERPTMAVGLIEVPPLSSPTPPPELRVVPVTTRLASPTATARLVPATSRPGGLPTVRPSATPLPPTVEPLPPPTATPHCGDPEDVRLDVEIVAARREQRGRDLVIHYDIRARNDSSFPATMADGVVVATLRNGGSEQFGHTAVPDTTIEPGALIALDGTVTLKRIPPPFGTVETCLRFVPETCGRRLEYRIVSTCRSVDGF
jgi:hypothetical protein